MGCYLGTDLSDEALGKLLSYLAGRAGIEKNKVLAAPKIETVRRVLEGREYYFVFNFTAKAAQVSIQVPMRDYLTGELYRDRIPLERNGFAVVAAEPEENA